MKMAVLRNFIILVVIVLSVETYSYRTQYHEDSDMKRYNWMAKGSQKHWPYRQVQHYGDSHVKHYSWKGSSHTHKPYIYRKAGTYGGVHVRHYKWFVPGYFNAKRRYIYRNVGWRNRFPLLTCESNCRIVRDRTGCYRCDCKPLCIPPKCDPGCEVQTVFHGTCPRCKCKDEGKKNDTDGVNVDEGWRNRHRCGWVKCKPNCRKFKDENGCFKCDCKSLCPPPNCDPGCEVQTVFVGPCPGCECKDEGKKDDTNGINVDEEWRNRSNCGWVKCDPNCRKVKDEEGCFKCDCEPVCPPEKCDTGCEVQTVLDEPCPRCQCKDVNKQNDTDGLNVNEVPLARICELVKCNAPCKEVFGGPYDCPKCICEDCRLPKCPEGCKVQEVFDGPCPGCDCGTPACPVVMCAPRCNVIEDENGCDICKCEFE